VVTPAEAGVHLDSRLRENDRIEKNEISNTRYVGANPSEVGFGDGMGKAERASLFHKFGTDLFLQFEMPNLLL
jgi:hypothetical protein